MRSSVCVTRRLILFATALASLLAAAIAAQARFTSYAETRDTLTALADILPPELKSVDAAGAQRAWTEWVQRQDKTIRSRLQRGDEETIVNWLLFGTTFTKLPRVTLDAPGGSAPDEAQRTKLIAARAADLVAALAAPEQDERRLFAQQLFAKQGYRTTSAPDRTRLLTHVNDLVQSVIAERAALTREIQAIRQAGDASDQFPPSRNCSAIAGCRSTRPSGPASRWNRRSCSCVSVAC